MHIRIENLDVPPLAVSGSSKSVLSSLLDSGLDWMHACGGKGRCSTCKVRVISGSSNLTPLSPVEISYREQNELREDERLTCQTRLLGDVTFIVPTEVKLPHVHYLDDSQ